MNELVRKEVSPEYLISLVEERPVIWDQSAELYRDHTEKKKAWRDICDALFENFNELDDKEKQTLTKSVIKKWSYIRDTWTKSMKKRESLETYRKPYIYEREMSFMKKVFEMNYKEGSGKVYPDSESSDDESVKKIKIKKRKLVTKRAKAVTKETVKPTLIEESSSEEISNSNEMTINLDNTDLTRHIMFFKSILPSLVKLSDNQILEYQSGVLKLLIKLTKPQLSQDDEPTTSCTWPLVKVTHDESAQQSDKSSESFVEEDIFS